MSDAFHAGQRVRLKSNPGRAGTISGEQIDRKGSVRWEVHFEDGSEFVPELALEAVTAESANPYTQMRDRRFMRARDLRTSLTHYRLSGRLADMIYSLDTTSTDFYPYQFKPVLNFLDSPCRGILIADEVGLGKTIEAGLIWTELRSREDAKRLLVLCPAMLREKWRRELRDRFGISATVCSADEVHETLRSSASAQQGFALIASLQGMRPPSGWDDDDEAGPRSGAARLARFLNDQADEEPLFDLVVIDEAHYLRNAETQTARLGRLVRPVAENLVLLSATPIQLRNTDLFNLLNLLDGDTFPFEWSFETALRENAPLVRLRDRLLQGALTVDEYTAALQEACEARELGASETLHALLHEPPEAEELARPAVRLELADRLDRVNPITKVVSRTRKRDVHERKVVRAPSAIIARMTPVEEGFYLQVTERVRAYCERRELAEGFMLTIPQRQLCSSMAAACRAWSNRPDEDESEEILWEAFGDEAEQGASQGFANIKPLIGELAGIARELGDYAALRAHDSKFEVLREQLLEYWRKFPDAKVVLFAYFRGTLRYLEERFRELGVSTAVLMGGMDKDRVLEDFASPEGARLLLSSEVASEGVDLQFSSLLVNYDLPWNPMRIEQRIGRIDRIGQQAERILIWNVFLGETLDDRVYKRLFARLEIFEEALGATEGILGDAVRKMSYELLRHHLTPDEEANVIELTATAMEKNLKLQNELEDQASRLVAHGDYLQTKINSARQLNRYVSADDLLVYVRDFVERNYDGSQFVPVAGSERTYEIDLGAKARAEFAAFVEQSRLQGRTRLASPASGRHLCCFENKLGRHDPRVEVISQYHPLVHWVARCMRSAEAKRHAPIAALRLERSHAPSLPPGRYVFSAQRWTVVGERTIERLVFSARRIGGAESAEELSPDQAELLVTSAALKGDDWLHAGGELDGEELQDLLLDAVDELDSRFHEFVKVADIENRDRVNFQLQMLDRHEREQIESLRRQIEQLRFTGKTRTIKANEGRIRKTRERSEDRRNRLSSKLGLTHEHRLAAGGVIEVN